MAEIGFIVDLGRIINSGGQDQLTYVGLLKEYYERQKPHKKD